MKIWNTGRGKRRLIGLLALFLISGCQKVTEEPKADTKAYEKYEAEFIGTFDVKIQIIGYSESESSFENECKIIYDKMNDLNKLFDIYNDYKGINNLKTINDNAGIQPVKVDKEIIDLLLFSMDAYERTDGLVNVAMGSVLRIWHDHRTAGIDDPEDATIPTEAELKEAVKHTNIMDVIIDEEEQTVYLADPEMSLDVGAVAKGYSAQLAKDEAVSAGLESAVINAGGNVLTVGAPEDGTRERWGIGIQDPKKTVDGVTNILDTVFLNDKSVVSSGHYQRYYEVDGKVYHHIIDPKTLFPAEYFAAVSVIYADSGTADYLSTAIFIAPYEEGVEIAKAHGAEVLWVFHDGSTKATEGYKEISQLFSGYSSQDE